MAASRKILLLWMRHFAPCLPDGCLIGCIWLGSLLEAMVAGGAGAGLATLYSVPLGGTLLILDVPLGTLSLPAPIPAV